MYTKEMNLAVEQLVITRRYVRNALEQANEQNAPADTIAMIEDDLKYHESTITALRQALEQQPANEPVGTAGELFTNTALERLDFRPSTLIYTRPQPAEEPAGKWMGDCIEWIENPYKFKKGQHIYIRPAERKFEETSHQPADEPVAYMSRNSHGGYSFCLSPQFFDNPEPLYTRPQPSAWVELTDEDYSALAKAVAVNKHQCRAIEAKLRELNTGEIK